MADPSTIDNQKVFNSARDKFSSFVGAVDNPSSSGNMKVIYDNMTKMFDAFTQGVLAEQGVNSEVILRTIYRSLNKDFIDIIKNTGAVDEIIKLMKQKQDTASKGDADNAFVSETTKKVVTKTLDPDAFDQMQVALDFIDELQSDILQVRLNVSREYEQYKLAHAKSIEGQQEDLDRLHKELGEQSQQIVQTVEDVSGQQKKLKAEQLKKIQELTDLFNSMDKSPYLGGFKELEKVIDQINLSDQSQQLNTQSISTTIIQIRTDFSKLLQSLDALQKQIQGIKVVEKVVQADDAKGDGTQILQKAGNVETSKQEKFQSEQAKEGWKKNKKDDAPRNAQEQQQQRRQDQKPIPQKETGNTPFQKKQEEKDNRKKEKTDNTRLGKAASPIENPLQKIQKSEANDISSSKVVETLGNIHNNIRLMLKDKKFVSNFMLNYQGIQKKVGGQMKEIDKSEEKLSKDVHSTEKGIASLKRNNKSGNILKTLLNPLGHVAVIALGGLILITLARAAIGKWKKTYMPKTDGSTMTIFGFQIPKWAEMKAFAIGIKNFVLVGLPTLWNKLKLFIGGVKDKLFGKKGIFRSMAWAKYTLKRIVTALILGWAKKGMGIVFKILGFALSFIPGFGPALKLLCDLMPLIITFVTNQIVSIMGKNQALGEMQIDQAVIGQFANTKKYIDKFTKDIQAASSKVFLFKGQKFNMPELQTPEDDKSGWSFGKGAIMRRFPMKYNANAKNAKAIQDDAYQKERDGENREIDTTSFNRNSLLQQIEERQKKIHQWHVEDKNKGIYDKESLKSRQDSYVQMAIGDLIQPQIVKIKDYIEQLSKLRRFNNVGGLLYDPITGWNPGYRVLQSDLMTAIPLTPFEEVHDKRDIKFGEPLEEPDQDGYMPFTWYQNGVKVTANPIEFEIQRAKGLIAVWLDIGEKMGHRNIRENVISGGYPAWRRLGQVTTYDAGHYPNIWYGDKIGNFYNKVKRGYVDDRQNRLDSVVGQKRPTYAETQGYYTITIANNNRMMAQPHNETKTDQQAKKMKDLYDSSTWKAFRDGNVAYNGVRHFILGDNRFSGFVSLGPVISDPISVANLLIDKLIDIEAWGKRDKKHPAIDKLFNMYFEGNNIRGWDKSDATNDRKLQAAFAQSFLEYLIFETMPLFRKSEVLLHNTLSDKNNKSKWNAARDGIRLLIRSLDKDKFVEFFVKYIRFPNMRVKVIDYANAKGYELTQVDLYRRKAGIPHRAKKKEILDRMKGIRRKKKVNNSPNKIPSKWDKDGYDDEIENDIEYFQKWMPGLAMEAKATGNYEFFNLVSRHLEKLLGEKNASEALTGGSKIAQAIVVSADKSISVPTSQIDEEKKAKEEQERKAKEAEEKRKKEREQKERLEKEAKRRQELAIAQQIIARQEAIRKQEETYESILQKMVGDPSKVTDADLKQLGNDVGKLKQEAENRISELPREQRELKLALIRGDTISTKTFTEMKVTASGLHNNLQAYMEEVNKIPVGNIVTVQRQTNPNASPLVMQDSDAVDLAS